VTKTKKCPKCGKRKRRAQFSRNRRAKDGLQYRCKACHLEYVNAWQQTDVGKASQRRGQAKYQQTEKGKAVSRATSAKMRAKHPKRHKARRAANYHVALAGNCEKCGSFTRLERHHHDYDQPLDVWTVCHQCHVDIHNRERGAAA
jgi:hypothetical protein